MIEQFGELELKRRISTEKINFLAFPVTPWAAHGVDAYIKMLEERGVRLKGYICVIKHGQAGYLLGKEHFQNVNKNIKIVQLDESMHLSMKQKIKGKIFIWFNLLKGKKSDNEKLYVLNQGSPNFEWHFYCKQHCPEYFVESVVIDEGIGMYMRDAKAWLRENLSNARGVKAKLSAYLMFKISQPLFIKRLKKNDEISYFCLLNKDRDGLKKNAQVITLYKSVVCLKNADLLKSEIDLYRNAVLINTQPFYEYGQVSEDEDLKWINIICIISEKLGLRVVLKPHPREKNLDRYANLNNCVIDLNKSISQETIIGNLPEKPLLIVGFSSTTLITESLFENINAISLVNCVDLKKFKGSILSDFEGFKRTFDELVYIPSNEEEIEEYIEKIYNTRR